VGLHDIEFQDVVNAGCSPRSGDRRRGGRACRRAQVVDGEISRLANAEGVEASSLVTPASVAALQQLVDAGTLTDKLARQVLEGVIAGEGTRRRSSTPAGSRSSPTTAR
jgi:aspartyl-tRNA(Asn)/glutamyl-tRNA(Gln) amidotransferase subunit B